MNKGSNTYKTDENSKNAKSIIDGILKIIYFFILFMLFIYRWQTEAQR